MNFEYTLKLDLPLDEAWVTLMDIEQIAPCMPGAKIESRDGDNYTGRLKVKLGPMEMTYRGDIHFVERDDDAKRAVVDAAAKEIKGRGAAKTQVTLAGTAVDGGSEIRLASEFSVSGKAAQFGRGVMEEVGEKLMDDFAQRLGAQIGSGAAAPDNAPAPASAAESSGQAQETPEPAPTPTATEDGDEALDVGGAAWAAVLKRLGIPIAIGVAVIVYWLL